VNKDTSNTSNAQHAIACILIGLRGSGKSTIGRQLASRIGAVFIDLDDLTAQSLGEPTAGQALQAHGQHAFRQAEAQQLKQTLSAITAAKSRVVLALGGGTPTAPTAAEQLQTFRSSSTTAHLIYLRAKPSTLRSRLATTNLTERPSLTAIPSDKTNAKPAEQTLHEIDDIFNQRDNLYTTLAHVIDIDDLTPEQLVDHLAIIIASA